MKFLIMLVVLFQFGCSGTKQSKIKTPDNKNDKKTVEIASIPTYIYKTRSDYYNNVPVLLSKDKKSIISFPAPEDILSDGKPTYPTRLNHGYLLDNRGININVAFLKLTYQEYSQLKSLPSPEALIEMILDNDPLTELCDCGPRVHFKDVSMVNEMINNNFKKCKRLK